MMKEEESSSSRRQQKPTRDITDRWVSALWKTSMSTSHIINGCGTR